MNTETFAKLDERIREHPYIEVAFSILVLLPAAICAFVTSPVWLPIWLVVTVWKIRREEGESRC